MNIDATYSHVSSTSCASGFSFGVDEPARYAKIAEFDIAVLVQEDVTGFHVAVNHSVRLFQVVERFYSLQYNK